MQVLVCIGCSVVASVITTKILATHYFDIVNGYVDGICNKTKDFVQSTESMISKCQHKDGGTHWNRIQKPYEEHSIKKENLSRIFADRIFSICGVLSSFSNSVS